MASAGRATRRGKPDEVKILRTYILKELFQPTLTALTLFTFVMVVGNLVKLADLFINKGVPVVSILQLFCLLVPELLGYTVPMAVLTGTLLAFGKLSSDREIMAMRTSGVSLWSIAAPILWVGLTLSLALIPVNDRVVPWTHYARRQLLEEIGIRNPTAFLEPGTFIKEFKPYIMFVYQVDGNKMTKIRIYQPREGHPTRTIVAEKGEFIPIPAERRVLVKLYDGTADEPDPKDPKKFYKLQFASYAVNLSPREGRDPKTLPKKPSDMNLQQLKEEARRLEAEGINAFPLAIEGQRRIALAFSPIVFMLVGLPLGITTRRAQRSVGFGLSTVVFIGYYLFLIVGQGLAQKEIVPAALALWLGNLFFSVIGIGLLFWSARR